MTLLMRVRRAEAVDTILRDRTIISLPNGETKTLYGAAHKTWRRWRNELWLKDPRK